MPATVVESGLRRYVGDHIYKKLYKATIIDDEFDMFLDKQNDLLDTKDSEQWEPVLIPSEMYVAENAFYEFKCPDKTFMDQPILPQQTLSQAHIDETIMQGKYSPMSFDLLSIQGQQQRELLVDSIILFLITNIGITEKHHIFMYRYYFHLVSTYSLLDMINYEYPQSRNNRINRINMSFAEMLRDEWLGIMNTFELEIDDLINQDAIDLSSSTSGSTTDNE